MSPELLELMCRVQNGNTTCIRALELIEEYYDKVRPKVDVDALANRFLACPLPESVCADLCATKQGALHRSGTNLLSFTEAKTMFQQCLSDNSVLSNAPAPPQPGGPAL